MRFTKFLAVAGAVSMLASALPFATSAEEAAAPSFEYKVVDGSAIITEVTTTETTFSIPETIEVSEGVEATVVGVEDFAFGLCENLELVYVPDSLTLDATGNVAFLTSSAVMNFMDNELGDSASTNDIVRYVAQKANYKNGNFTDADLADVAVKLESKLNMVDVSVANTVEGKVMTLLKNVDQMNLNPDLQNSFDVWITTITYNGFTLCGSEGTQMQEYAVGREFLGMVFKAVATDYVIGDANGDGTFNVRDAAFVASTVAKGQTIDTIENPAADYNGDGTVNVRDAAAMARDLSSAKG